MRLFDSQPHRVPITKEFLALGRSAYSHYVHRLEQEKAEAAKKKAELEAQAAEQVERAMVQRELVDKTRLKGGLGAAVGEEAAKKA